MFQKQPVRFRRSVISRKCCRIPLIYPCLFMFLVVLLAINLTTPIHAQNNHNKNILVLNSYNYGYGWTDSIMKGIEAILPQRHYNLTAEYMDTKRYEQPAYFQKLYDFYHYKFASQKFDVIICSDDNAFNFLKKYKSDLFATQTPVVFCGVNFFQDADLKGRQDFTGVVENYDIAGTIEIIRNLQPNLKEILVISDLTATGTSNTLKARKVMAEQFPQQKYTLVDDVTMEELFQILGRAPVGTIALYLGFAIDKTGKSYAPLEESLAVLSRRSKLPFYSVWEFTLESVVGGMITSGYYQGEMAAKMAKRLLDGEKVATIPVVKESPNKPMFNYKQMERFGISPSQLPPGSIIINQPDSFYDKHKSLVLGTMAVLAGLIMVIIVLTIAIKKRKRAEEALLESEQKYRLLLANIPAMVFTGYADWAVDFLDDKVEALTGYPLNDFHSRRVKWSDLIMAEDIGRAKEIFIEALRSTRAYVREYRIRAKNGEVHWVRERGRIFCDPQGRIDQVTGVFSDITEQHKLSQELEQLQRQQEMILHAAGEGILGLNRQGEVTFANPAAAAMIGYEPGELVGRPMHDLIHHTRADGTQHLREDCPIYAALQGGETHQVNDDFFWRQDGQGFHVEYVASPVMEQGQPVGMVVVFRDITRRRQDEAALGRANDHLRRMVVETQERHRTISLLKDMVDGLQSCHTTEEAYAAISLSAAKLFPEDSGALYLLNSSQNYFEAVAVWGESPPSEAFFAPDDCWSVRRNRLHLVTASHPELPCRHLTDSCSSNYLCAPMMVQGGAPGVLHIRLSTLRTPGRTAEEFKTQAESRLQLAVTMAEHLGLSLANLKLRETLRHQAIRDPLTKLFNRRYLEETLGRELLRARRENTPVGVIMMDLDHFKQFNDSFGHAAGDTLLRELGQLIKRRIREEDVPCRWGGEEFLLIMPGASMDIVRARAEEIRQDMKQLMVEDRGISLGPITISLGAATFPEHGATGEEIVRAADTALYCAKQEGRNRVVAAESSTASRNPS